jgi:hypothetical protein
MIFYPFYAPFSRQPARSRQESARRARAVRGRRGRRLPKALLPLTIPLDAGPVLMS